MARKKSKRKKAKVVQMSQAMSTDKYIKLHARKLPILKVFASSTIMDDGIGYVIVSRKKKNNDIVSGVYLIDVWCLGLKDTFFKIFDEEGYEDFIVNISTGSTIEEVDPEYAYNLVYGAVEFAEDIGFQPNKGFSITEYILPDVESIEYIDIEFGQEGRPYYLSGPYDNVGKIMSHLNKHVGEGNFGYTMKVEDNEDDEFEFTEWRQEVLDSPFFQLLVYLAKDVLTIYQNDLAKLESDFINNPEKACSTIEANLSNPNVIDKNHVDEFRMMLLATMENLIIFGDSDYLFEEENMLSFSEDSEFEGNLVIELTNMSLVQHGNLKLEILCNTILSLENNGKDETDQEFLEEAIEKYGKEGRCDFMQEESEIALELIDMHVEAFGAIDFSKIDLTKHMEL